MLKKSRLAIVLSTALFCAASHAETFYVPHRIVVPQGFGPGIVIEDLNDKGEMVGVAGATKGFYWPRYDQAKELPFPGNDDAIIYRDTQVKAFGLNNRGEIVGSLFRPGQYSTGSVMWTLDNTGNPVYGNFNFNNGARKINDANQIAFIDVHTTPSFLDVGIFSLSNAQSSLLNMRSLYPNDNFWPHKINANGSLVATDNRLSENWAADRGVYHSAQTGNISEQGQLPDYSFINKYQSLNDNEDVVGTNIRVLASNGETHYYCKYVNHISGSVDREFTGNALAPAGAVSTHCDLRDVNNYGTAIGDVSYSAVFGSSEAYAGPLIYDRDTNTLERFIDKVRFATDVFREEFEAVNSAGLQLTRINNSGSIIGRVQPPNASYYVWYYFEGFGDGTSNPIESLTQTIDNTDPNVERSENWLALYGKFTVVLNLEASAPHWTVDTTLAGKEGDDYLVSTNSGCFSWNHTILADGNYEVRAKWPADNANDTQAKYTVIKKGVDTASSTTLGNQTFNQSGNAGFELIGTFNLNEGDDIEIVLTGSGNGNLIADAVQLVRVF